MKDVAWSDKPCEVGVFGGHVDFHNRKRFWDFKSVAAATSISRRSSGRCNDIGYTGPLSVEWEDGGMDREHGAVESAAFVHDLDFPASNIVFDAQFDKERQA